MGEIGPINGRKHRKTLRKKGQRVLEAFWFEGRSDRRLSVPDATPGRWTFRVMWGGFVEAVEYLCSMPVRADLGSRG